MEIREEDSDLLLHTGVQVHGIDCHNDVPVAILNAGVGALSNIR